MTTTGEQVFIDALGREPTSDELQEIRLSLWMLTRAGFAVDDASNAPLIAPWAWIWARLPRPMQVHAALDAARREIAALHSEGIGTIEAAVKEIPAKLDHGALAGGIVERMRPLVVHNRIDGSLFRTALRESFSLLWVWLAAVCVGAAGIAGWHLGMLHVQAVLAPQIAQQGQALHREQQLLDRLTRARPRP